MQRLPTNQEKDALWEQYRAGRPSRVPVILATNNRVYVLDPRFNTHGMTYEEMFRDPEKMLLAQLRWLDVTRTHYHRFCDYHTGLPEKWEVGVHFQNVSEAWFLGCEVNFKPGQVPDTSPILNEDNKRSIFGLDISNPLSRDPYKRGIEFTERMRDIARSMDFKGRPVSIVPYLPIGSDGPLTVALNLRGGDFLTDLVLDPDYAQELMSFITQAALNRTQTFLKRHDKPIQEVWFADDSIETLSVDMYREKVLPHHRRFYDTLDPERKLRRTIHLCGDAWRHFPTIVRELGVKSIDTGFPIDFKRVREEVGPDVEVLGGVEVTLLVNGTAKQVYERAAQILASGITRGRKFIFREANNLPPATPEKNLEAMYRAVLELGQYHD